MKKCIFFDRDGIVNRSPGPGYVESWADFILLDEFVAALSLVRSMGYDAVIITNQRGVARGITPIETINDIHSRLKAVLKEEHGLELLDILFCPHDNNMCDCRKPKPGMILSAADKHGIDLTSSWMIGDNIKDVEAGRAAGCRTILVSSSLPEIPADYRLNSMSELASLLKSVLAEDQSTD